MVEGKRIILAIDSSSSCSGLALFVNSELKEYTEIKHRASARPSNNHVDLEQNRMQEVIDKLLFKYLSEYENIREFKIVIELPNMAYKGVKAYGRQMFYGGLWLGKITALISAIPTIMDKTKFINVPGGQLVRHFKFDAEHSKEQSVDKVKELYNVDLRKLNIPKYDQKGLIKRDKHGEIVYLTGLKHNCADAILIGAYILGR